MIFCTAFWLLITLFNNVHSEHADIHHLLTSEERLLMFGTASISNVPAYQTTRAQSHIVRKRALGDAKTQQFFRLNVEGRERILQLFPNSNLISPYFIFKSDGAVANVSGFGDCLFKGKFTDGTGRAAVSTCSGPGTLMGMIETESSRRYHVHPVPQRLQGNSSVQGLLHLLVPTEKELVNDTFCGVTETAKTDHKENSPRQRRNHISDTKVYIETAVFADYMLYKTLVGTSSLPDHNSFVKFILAIVNTVQMIYSEETLGRSVEIVLVRLEILQNEHFAFYNEEVDKYLWDFCKWQARLNPGTDLSTPNHWDHAIILTGFDLRSGSVRSVTGYAPVGGMCNPMYSCTINEGNHFGAAFVIAHEMGHSLTMQHDGQAGVSGNGCDAQRNLMSPSTGRGKTTWSSCSRQYLDKFLSSPQSQCLKDVPPGHPLQRDPIYSSFPGQVYPADDQCKLLYGTEFHHYSSQPSSDVCEILICANTTVYITGHPALPGTYCGSHHWCSGGSCVPWGSTGPMVIDGGWSLWPATAGCSTECTESGTGLRIFERSCSNPIPVNGGKACEGKTRKYQMCDQTRDCSSRDVLSISEYANQQCQRTKSSHKDLTLSGSGRQRLQDPTAGCIVWCDTFLRGYKTWGTKFPDGTKCGESNATSYCVDGQCGTFACDGWTLDESSAESCRQKHADNATNTPGSASLPVNANISSVGRVAVLTTESPVFSSTWPVTSGPSVASVNSYSNGGPITGPNSSIWGEWERKGLCKSSCVDDSVALEELTRTCISGGSCLGLNRTVSICPLDCPSVVYSASSYVTKICSAIKSVDSTLTGLGTQLPYVPEDPRLSCRLWCHSPDTLRAWPEMYFPDGTLCAVDSGAKSYCVQGYCTRFSCNGTPVDAFDTPICYQQPGLSLLLSITSRDITSGKPSLIQPVESGIISHDTRDGPERYEWLTMSTPCSQPCGGGTKKNSVMCVNPGISLGETAHKVDLSLCSLDSKPAVVFEEVCNIQACAQWSTSRWMDCTGTCGNATMARLVQCVFSSSTIGAVVIEIIVEDSLCDMTVKPALIQDCVPGDCPP